MPKHDPIQIIDTHTGGEPTRVVVGGGPPLGEGSLAERVNCFREKHDRYRTAVLNEPRGSDVMVGALLCEPVDSACLAGIIFFNNVGYLGMCGHGTLGVVAALAHQGRLLTGKHRLETPVGVVEIESQADGQIAFDNVASYRYAKRMVVALADGSLIHGDIAYGGNWFFLVDQQEHRQTLDFSRCSELTAYCLMVREALHSQHITGENGAEIDHIELFAATTSKGADSRSFVLCPGGAYDRSPCGTGTSAKLACLAADDKLAEGEPWVQESIVGSRFTASYRLVDRCVVPRIAGSAFVNGETSLILNEHDPFCWGIC